MVHHPRFCAGTTLLKSTLTLVKLTTSKKCRHGGDQAPGAAPAAAAPQAEGQAGPSTSSKPALPAAEPAAPPQLGAPALLLWLPERLGPAWALLDGDLSPMHLSRLGARLAGFKRLAASVHCVTALLEAEVRAKLAAGAPGAPWRGPRADRGRARGPWC